MADWAKIDVGFLRHPQVVGLTGTQQLGFLALILYAQEHETDGAIPEAALRFCGVAAKDAKAMADVGLLRKDGPTWVIDGFARKQRTKAEMNAVRKQRKAAADARWGRDDDAARTK